MRTLEWDENKQCIRMIDQTKLPEKLVVIEIRTVDDLCEAILNMRVRGAPAIGVAGAFGVALSAVNSDAITPEALMEDVERDAKRIVSLRPTARNLSWAVERVLNAINDGWSVEGMKRGAVEEAIEIAKEDVELNKKLSKNGSKLISDGDTVLTHCNAGALACVEWGTALGVIRWAVLEEGKNVSVIACETRPLNQGSRLTCYELSRDGIDVTLVCDSTAAYLMRKGSIDSVIVGADRITQDAVFNKIGTYMHSVCAKEHGIPFYVASPLSTFDFEHYEEDIEIEIRDEKELKFCDGKRLAPDVPIYNPAFDATPIENVSAIITEKEIIYPPFLIEEYK